MIRKRIGWMFLGCLLGCAMPGCSKEESAAGPGGDSQAKCLEGYPWGYGNCPGLDWCVNDEKTECYYRIPDAQGTIFECSVCSSSDPAFSDQRCVKQVHDLCWPY